MLARLWFKFCCQNFRPLLTKENAGIPSSATERTATTELQRPQLSLPCSFCLLIVVPHRQHTIFFGPRGPLIESSTSATRPSATIFLLLLLLLLLFLLLLLHKKIVSFYKYFLLWILDDQKLYECWNPYYDTMHSLYQTECWS